MLQKDGQIAALQKEVGTMLASNKSLRAEAQRLEAEATKLRKAAVQVDQSLDEAVQTSRKAARKAESLSSELVEAKRRIEKLMLQLDEQRGAAAGAVVAARVEGKEELSRIIAERQELETRLDRATILLQVLLPAVFCIRAAYPAVVVSFC